MFNVVSVILNYSIPKLHFISDTVSKSTTSRNPSANSSTLNLSISVYIWNPTPVEYQRILNNYIQKGRRKLEACSYSKMKASCPARERVNASVCSTSTIETATTSTLPSARADHQFQPGPNTSVTAIINNLPLPTCKASFDKVTSISDSKHTVEMSKSSSLSCPTLYQSATNRTTAGLLKTARLYHCRDCSSSYNSSELLRKHSCIIAEQYQCHLCLREFRKRKTLDQHMKSHDKVFSTDDDLRK
ncbi:uncharacterized protein LOC128302640 [Anopheles moucheti]|uniref:uncharacterized protein LOC128302640 n=1 Tax=Anopheles moucheti TaxID=186751 RepID=UPI0022F056B4|nr:uncharacterized protein LOC128302640 [Anopheles moucheti]